MKKITSILLIILSVSVFAQTAKIRIDVEDKVGKIDPKLYGVFMEPIHFSGEQMESSDTGDYNTLYGTLYDPSSPLANEDGFRKDYIKAMKELNITNMRWPGGNFAMGYNWQDGIGPKEKRPNRINMAWGGIESNHVGTDEWIALNEAIGSQNIVCANLGLGDIKNACYWVEYCNYEKGTHYSNLRAKYGHPEPYNIKIWNLGNEVDGEPWELGHKNAEDYVKVAREAAKAMKSVDESIDLVASGSSYYESTGKWVDWNYKILKELGDKIKYLSVHRYWEESDDYYTFMGASAKDFEEKIRVTSGLIDAVKAMKDFNNPIYIAFDEWGLRANNFRSVLPVAQSFNSFLRYADVVKMTNFTMLTGLLSEDSEKGTYKTPLFYTFKLFSNNCRGSSVDTYVECDTFNTEEYKNIPFLDVSSVYSKENNTVYINVVNRHKDKAITTDILNSSIKFKGKAEASLLKFPLDEEFTYDKQEQYKPETKQINTQENKLSYSFPAHSFTQIKVQLRE